MHTFSPVMASRTPMLVHHLTGSERRRPTCCLLSSPSQRPQVSCWTTTNSAIDAHLRSSLPDIAVDCVRDPMTSLAFSAPPTMAPALCVKACELVGGEKEQAMDAACALRLMSSALYAHEALLSDPSGKAFPSKAGVQLMTADGLLPLGYQLAAGDSSQTTHPASILKVIVEITNAMGPKGVLGGLYHQEAGAGDGAEWVERICEEKEGMLHACGAACGAILGGGEEEEVEKLRRYGAIVGTLYGLLCGTGKELGWKLSTDEEKRLKVAKALKSRAMAELDGFETSRRDEMLGLLNEILSFI